jgi:predicted phosphatase
LIFFPQPLFTIPVSRNKGFAPDKILHLHARRIEKNQLELNYMGNGICSAFRNSCKKYSGIHSLIILLSKSSGNSLELCRINPVINGNSKRWILKKFS